MSVTVTVNGSNYTIPQTDETTWGDSVTSWIQAVSTAMLQKSGGTFTLTAEVDFGGSFGLKALYVKSETANAASAGVIRLANTDSVAFRNSGNSADLLLTPGADGLLNYNGVPVVVLSATKGDLAYSSADGTWGKIPIGSTGQVLKVSGGVPAWSAFATSLSVTTKTANYTLTGTDDLVQGDATGGTFTLTLPSAVSNAGKVFYLKKIDSSANAISIATTSAQTIDGASSQSLNAQWEFMSVASDGSNWKIVTYKKAIVNADISSTAAIARNKIAAFVGARYTATSTASIPGVSTVFNFSTQSYDPQSIVTTGAAWKATVPSGYAGKWRIHAATRTNASVAAEYNADILVNGSAIRTFTTGTYTSGNISSGIQISDILNLSVGDYVQVAFYCAQTSTFGSDQVITLEYCGS